MEALYIIGMYILIYVNYIILYILYNVYSTTILIFPIKSKFSHNFSLDKSPKKLKSLIHKHYHGYSPCFPLFQVVNFPAASVAANNYHCHQGTNKNGC